MQFVTPAWKDLASLRALYAFVYAKHKVLLSTNVLHCKPFPIKYNIPSRLGLHSILRTIISTFKTKPVCCSYDNSYDSSMQKSSMHTFSEDVLVRFRVHRAKSAMML